MFSRQAKGVDIASLLPLVGRKSERVFKLIVVAVADWGPDFGGYDDVFARQLVMADCFPEDFFRDTV